VEPALCPNCYLDAAALPPP